MPPLLRLSRPRQWTKNLLVFAALIFAGQFSDSRLVTLSALAFVAFTLAGIAVYAANDALDAEADRQHPKKQHRPVASGQIKPSAAWAYSFICAGAGLGIAGLFINLETFVVIAIYLSLQAAYVAGVKHVAVLDVFVVATGFVLRAVAGGTAISAPVSNWLLFCTGALALMLGTAKRRQEFRALGAGGTRASLAGYNERSLDVLVSFSAGLAALSYGVYAIESQTAADHPILIGTTPFVLFGIARYLVLVFGQEVGEEPEEVLLKDRMIQAAVVGFLAVSVWALMS